MRKFLIYLLAILAVASATISCSDDNNEKKVLIPDSEPSEAIPSTGFYIANEDWFGRDNGTVNFISAEGDITYRAYRAVNPGETFGTSTQYATVYGDNIYFVSKQSNRLVVTDKSLKKKAVFSEIGGDGRSFVGINPDKGYIATSSGISVFDIKNLTVGNKIAGISSEIGNIYPAGERVFAVDRSQGIQIININTDQQERILTPPSGTYGSMTQSKDGNLWVNNESAKTLTKINPYTLEQTSIDISPANISNPWFTWNAGSLCASTQNNILYWISGKDIIKYDIESNNLTTIYTLGTDDEDKTLAYYGAGLRVDPLSDKLIATVRRSGWGDSYSYNWAYILSANGILEKAIKIKGGTGDEGTENDNYYWFPAMPFFEDNNKPEILLNQIILEPNESIEIDLSEKIVDADNSPASISKTITIPANTLLSEVSLEQNKLTVKAKNETGTIDMKIKAVSNGQSIEKNIRVDVRY